MEHALKKFRETHGRSAVSLAEAVKTSRQTIYRIERWEQMPTLDLIARIIDATGGGVRADDFLPNREAAQ